MPTTKKVIGITETVTILGKKQRKVQAKIDTGATKSSIDLQLAAQLHLGPVLRSKVVKSAHGSRLRPLIECEIILAGKKMKTEFTLATRDHLKYKVLIGQNALKKYFLIDPSKQ